MKAIQEVSISSEEFILRRTVKAFKTALKESADENRPKMKLKFRDPKPPIKIAQGGTVTMEFVVTLVKGDIGRLARVTLRAPKNFSLIPADEKHVWHKLRPTKRYSGIDFMIGDMLPNYNYHRRLTIKATQEADIYELGYQLQCLEFSSKFELFEVSVV